MFYESRGCLLTYLVLDKQNPVESLLFEYSRIKVDEQKKVESVKGFYENQEERAKQFAERTSQNFVTVRKLQLLSEWISLSCLRENSVLRSVVILSFLASQFC